MDEPKPTRCVEQTHMNLTAADIITVDELAECIGANRKTVYRWFNAGQLPGARRLGRSIRIHKPTVLAWLEKGEGPKLRKRER